MAVPKKKTSKSRRDQRRSHHYVVTGQADSCANCGETKQRHHVCFSCGYYRGRLVISHRPAA